MRRIFRDDIDTYLISMGQDLLGSLDRPNFIEPLPVGRQEKTLSHILHK